MIAIVVLPEWRVAGPVKTPFPTAADLPWIWTTALSGVTVPRIVTVSAPMTLPLVGELTVTVTPPVAVTAVVVVVVVEPQPVSSTARSATRMPVTTRPPVAASMMITLSARVATVKLPV
jgi:hypothetical protein